MSIDDIIEAIQNGKIRVTDHAFEEADNDRLTLDEIYYSVLVGEIIEHYQQKNESSCPRCLIYGHGQSGQPIHSVWAYNKDTQWAVLITVYRPDPKLWVNWRERR